MVFQNLQCKGCNSKLNLKNLQNLNNKNNVKLLKVKNWNDLTSFVPARALNFIGTLCIFCVFYCIGCWWSGLRFEVINWHCIRMDTNINTPRKRKVIYFFYYYAILVLQQVQQYLSIVQQTRVLLILPSSTHCHILMIKTLPYRKILFDSYSNCKMQQPLQMMHMFHFESQYLDPIPVHALYSINRLQLYLSPLDLVSKLP